MSDKPYSPSESFVRDMFGNGHTVVANGKSGSAIIGHYPPKGNPVFISVHAEDIEKLCEMLRRKSQP